MIPFGDPGPPDATGLDILGFGTGMNPDALRELLRAKIGERRRERAASAGRARLLGDPIVRVRTRATD